MSTPFDRHWLETGACVPVDIETMAALVSEIHRLIDVIGGMALPVTPLYTTPPQPKREWVGLTDMEKEQFYNEVDDWDECVDWVEAKLKEKNA